MCILLEKFKYFIEPLAGSLWDTITEVSRPRTAETSGGQLRLKIVNMDYMRERLSNYGNNRTER